LSPPFEWLEVAGRGIPIAHFDEGAVDLIGAAFYWLSGWDEYARTDRDEHGRVTFRGSIQETLGDRPFPYVDPIREGLASELGRQGIAMSPRPPGWRFCVTHDIDYIRKWTPGSALRVVRRMLRDKAFRRRFALRANPFREAIFRMLDEVQSIGGRATYFFKAGAGSIRDVHYDLEGRLAQEMIQAVSSAGMEIGLHPAYDSFLEVGRLSEERLRLKNATGVEISASRQHYLRTALPDSARCLVEVGLSVDATLGFPDAAGFRNATTYPFLIFDLPRKRPLPVVAVPLAFMDASLFNRQQLDVDAATDIARWTMEEARRYGGIATGLWHNVLWEEGEYPHWGEHFERCLAAAVELDADIVSITDAAGRYSPASDSICATPE
jgi:hypothetical protein